MRVVHETCDTSKGKRQEIKLIVDEECNQKRKKGRLSHSNLRYIVGYYCCKHVAYGFYSCRDHNFFYKSSQQKRSAVPHTCPFVDGGRLYCDDVDEI